MKTLTEGAPAARNGGSKQSGRVSSKQSDPPLSLAAAGELLDGSVTELRRMAAAAGMKEEDFIRLPGREQNEFLAQARGQARTGVDPNERREVLEPLQCFTSPWNREHFNQAKLEKLIESVRQHGVIQDGIVRPLSPACLAQLDPGEKLRLLHLKEKGLEAFEIVAGERRLRAAELAKRKFPAKVRQLTDEEAIELQKIENFQREDLSPMDEAESYQQLIDIYLANGRAKTKEEAIARIGQRCSSGGEISRSSITDALALLKLPAPVQEAVREGKLPPTHARELAKLREDEAIQLEVLQAVVKPAKEQEGDGGVLSVKQTIRLVKERVGYLTNRRAWLKMKAEFEAKGWRVLDPQESWKITTCSSYNDWWGVTDERFVAADQKCKLPGANWRDYEKLWRKAPPGILAQLETGKPAVIYDRAAADEAVRAGGKLEKVTSSGRAGSSTSAADRAREQKHKRRVAAFNAVMKELPASEEHKSSRPEMWRLVARLAWRVARSEPQRKVTKALGCEQGEVTKRLATAAEPICRAVTLMLLATDCCAPTYYGGDKWDPEFLEVCKLTGIDLERIEGGAGGKVQSIGQAAPGSSTRKKK